MPNYEIPLKICPSQEFSVVIGIEMFSFRFKTIQDKSDGKEHLYMDLTFNDAPVFMGILCKPDIDILESFRSIKARGRLIFITESGDYPNWKRLGVSDRLYYVI